METLIEKYYEKYNFPNATKLYTIMKKNGETILQKDIINYLNKKEEVQVLKPIIKKSSGHIIAYYTNEFWNIDIFDLSKFESSNKHFKYILCAIDIFTRKAYCEAIKTKSEADVTSAMEIILKKAVPINIISDSDSTFLSNNFQALMKKYNINYNNVVLNDHHSLGVIDRFALTLKKIIAKYRIITKNSNWVDKLDNIVNTYNDTVHLALDNISPNEAATEKHKEEILELNIEKSKQNRTQSDLKHGDKVRLLEKTKFSRIGDNNYSSEVYTVDTSKLKTVVLTDGKKVKRDMLLKVNDGSVTTVDITKKITDINKVKRTLLQDGIDLNNIIKEKRKINFY